MENEEIHDTGSHVEPTVEEANESESFWRDLLGFIKAGRVIPVVGDHAVTFGKEDKLFSSYVAATLAGPHHLKIDAARLSPEPTLTDVACEWLVKGGRASELYKQCYFVCEEFERQAPMPGRGLLALASISKFNLFLTTTFDSLLAHALLQVKGLPPAVRGFFPNKEPGEKDLPARRAHLPGTTVYHLFGQSSIVEGEYVLWEEDVLQFICALHAILSSGKDLDLLSRDLADNALLFIGLNFSDLLVRLFLRVAKQRNLVDLHHTEILTEHAPGFGQRGNIMFFGGVMKNIHVRRQNPVEFALELAKRCEPFNRGSGPVTAARTAEIPQGAIFISYAREDEAAARLLSDGLKEHGCVVWFDRERLKAGGFWPEELKETVERVCSVFVSLVSSTTEDSTSGYWRRERLWAIDRAAEFYPEEFYIPVWIDERQPPFRREPEKVRSESNAVPLPVFGTPAFERFAERLRALQIRRQS